MPNYTNTCSFLHLKLKKKIVKTPVKKVCGEKHSIIELAYVVGAHCTNVYQQHILVK